ncbi:hypothetical protein IAU59_006818 [Kwoniella sp. CBS 9459]
MGLQRTPPHRVQALPATSQPQFPVDGPHEQQDEEPSAEPFRTSEAPATESDRTSTSEGDKTTLSNLTPGRAFAPRRPGVIRTPPPGDERPLPLPTGVDGANSILPLVDERPIRPAPSLAQGLQAGLAEADRSVETESMEVDQTSPTGHWGNIAGMSSRQKVVDPVAQIHAQEEAEAEAEAAVEAEMITEEPSMREDEQPTSTAASMDIDPMPTTTPTVTQPTQPKPRQSIRPQTQPQSAAQLRAQSHPYARPVTPELASSVAGPSNSSAAPVPTTPASAGSSAPKTPRSRSRSRRPTEPLPSPPRPLPLDNEQEEYGRRYQLTMETLERAIKAGAQRWTPEHLKGCFPQLSKDNSKAMENMCLSASQSMASNILKSAQAHMEHYKVGAALRSIDAVDQEAREYARNNPSSYGSGKCERPDAWRPDLTPQALVAATVLPIYDESYAKLREEYLELHNYCADKYKSIREKQALLKEIEEGVADSVVDLQKTIEILDRLPVEDMAMWTETVDTKLDTRAPAVNQ